MPSKNASYYKKINNSSILPDLINQDQVVECIKTVMDPEIPVNIYDLGLIYDIKIVIKMMLLLK